MRDRTPLDQYLDTDIAYFRVAPFTCVKKAVKEKANLALSNCKCAGVNKRGVIFCPGHMDEDLEESVLVTHKTTSNDEEWDVLLDAWHDE